MSGRWRTAWITGASSGIGRALALRLAASGVTVAASARNTTALADLARDAPAIHAFPLDVTDHAAVHATARDIARQIGAIDLAVFNAGIGRRMGLADFDAAEAGRTMAVNYQGLVNGVEAVLPTMLANRSGHIALMASLAGYRGLPRAASYTPSKAAAIALAESLAPELDGTGVRISLINPGFVATAMTERASHPLPFLIEPDEAARRIVAGLERGRFNIAFPRRMAALMTLGRLLPAPVYFALLKAAGVAGKPPETR